MYFMYSIYEKLESEHGNFSNENYAEIFPRKCDSYLRTSTLRLLIDSIWKFA